MSLLSSLPFHQSDTEFRHSMTGDPIFRKLDPYRIIMWPLYREATRYKGGEYIKVGSCDQCCHVALTLYRIFRTSTVI